MIEQPDNPGMMARLSPVEKEIAAAQRTIADYEANYDLAIREGDMQNEAFYRDALVQAYTKVGEFDKALKLKGWDKDAAAIKAAVGKNDRWRCHCDDPTIEVETSRAKPPAELLTTRWVAKEQMWSKKHNKIATLYECSVCHFQNALDSPPDELAAEIALKRSQYPKENEGSDAQVLTPVNG